MTEKDNMDKDNTNFKDIAKKHRSETWKYFHYTDQLEKGLCLKSEQKLSAKNHSTKGLLDHLKFKHGIDLREEKEDCVVLLSLKK